MQLVLTQPPTRSDDAGQNIATVLASVAHTGARLMPEDILLLPELVGCEASRVDYELLIREAATQLGCHVVGGSHHDWRQGSWVNGGVVANPDGAIIAEYEKLRPYGVECDLGVRGGDKIGCFELAGRRVWVLICSDFWFSDLFHRFTERPDLILIPTFSVSQKSEPNSAQSLWKHMAVARSYKYVTYVGISDWAHPCRYHGMASSGVAGMANPRPHDRRRYFAPVGEAVVAVHTLDFARLDALRENRSSRAFLWQIPPTRAVS